MGLYQFIESLQNKPEEQKKRILVLLTLISFVLLVGLWIISFNNQVSFVGQTTDEAPKNQEDKMLGPLASLKNGLGLVFQDIKGKTSQFLSDTNELIRTPTKQRPVYELPGSEEQL